MAIERFKLKVELFMLAVWNEWGFGVGVKFKQAAEQICAWNLPDPTWVKLNFDGSKELASNEAGAGYIIRNDIGRL